MKNIFFLFLLFTLSISTSKAQELIFHVGDMPDTSINLAKYYGQKLYYADTAIAKNGTIKFDASKHEPGIYALIIPPTNSYFQFLVTGEETVELNTKGPNFAATMEVMKSKENKAFYEYIGFMNEKSQAAQIINEKKAEASADEKNVLNGKLTELQVQVEEFQNAFFKKNSDLLVSKYLKIMKDVKIPQAPVKDDGSIDSTFGYFYQLEHYFDNVDLKDDRMVKGPMFHNKFMNYFSDRVMIQNPDTISKYADKLIAKLEPGSEMYKYVVHNLTYKYESSEIMGMDAVFVHMAKTYYCPPNNKAFWLEDDQITKICERADKLNPLRLGQKAPYLALADSTEKNWINFYELPEDYVVLYFWDPECGHCKKVTPLLAEIYRDSLKPMGVEVYAVGKAMGDDFEKWKKFIRDNDLSFINVGITKSIFDEAQENPMNLIKNHTTIESLNYTKTYDIYSTPRVFIVDKNRKFIAKGIGVEQIVGFMERYIKNHPNE